MITVQRPDVYIASDTPSVDSIVLKANTFTMTSLPVVIGELSESMALSSRRRMHNSEDGAELTLELVNTIPFGTEPAIQRKFRITEGIACMTMDITMRPACKLTELSAGGLLINGDIQRVALVCVPQNGSSIEKPEYFEFSSFAEKEGVIYDAEIPPLGLILESNTERFDWMIGDDLWRWTNASKLGGSCRFRITRQDNAIKLEWKLFSLPTLKKGEEAPEIAGRNWRLTWAVSWKDLPLPRRKAPAKNYDLIVCNWPRPTLAVADDEDDAERGCLCAAATLNILKKWVRSNLDSAKEGDVFALKNVMPVYCTNASHIDRARHKELAHWDMMSIIEFCRWSNRVLSKHGASMKILAPDKSPLRGFMILG